jgi:hypothetical protein
MNGQSVVVTIMIHDRLQGLFQNKNTRTTLSRLASNRGSKRSFRSTLPFCRRHVGFAGFASFAELRIPGYELHKFFAQRLAVVFLGRR